MKKLCVSMLLLAVLQSSFAQSTIVIASAKPFIVNKMSNGKKLPNKKYIYRISLTDGSIFQAETMVDMYSNRYFVTIESKDGMHNIRPSQTKSISRVTKDGHEVMGLPYDSCWLFIAATGKIKAYAPVAEMKIEYTTAIQKDDGPIVPLTVYNLINLIGTPSVDVQKLIDQKKLVKALDKYNLE